LNARARGANIFELFANSPPWWMCRNHDPCGATNGTSDNLQPSYYDQDAIYLATIAQYARDHWGFPGATYRVMARGNQGRDPANRGRFIKTNSHWLAIARAVV
jgi:hypothetical protein